MLNMEDLLKIECDERLSDVVSIVDHNQTSKEYKYILKNGDVNWITILNDKHPRVNEYLKTKNINVEVFDANKGNWMIPIWEEQWN